MRNMTNDIAIVTLKRLHRRMESRSRKILQDIRKKRKSASFLRNAAVWQLAANMLTQEIEVLCKNKMNSSNLT